MKKEIRHFFIVAALFLLPNLNFGQSHELVVPDFITSSQFLETFILGDTTTFGTRKDYDRVYVLKRGGSYYVSVSLSNQSVKTGAWPLRIKAESGTGARPVIYAYRNTNGAYNTQIFNNYDVIDLQSVVLVGWSAGLEAFDRNVTRLVNGAALGATIILDDCILTDASATLVQTSSAAKYVKATNTTFANSANLKQTNLGNGRAIDFRDVAVDSVYIENCSFLNFTDRVLRHYNALAPIKKFYLNHNTFVNILAEHGCLSLGRIQGDVKINNNLFVDNFIFGNDSSAYQGTDSRIAEFLYTGEVGPNGKARMTMVGSVKNDTSFIKWEIRNNYYSISPAVQTFYDTHTPPGLGDLIPLTWHINGKLGADSVNAFQKLATPIVFGNTPATPLAFAEWFFKPIAEGGAGKSKSNANFTLAVDFDRKDAAYYQNTLDLKYSTSSPAYTGADNGLPVGATTWWGIVLDVQKTDVIPTTFSLEQNYPNPFNPATKISYNLPKSSQVKLEVFDILGRKVATLVDQFQQVGQYKVDFVASKLSSGVYIYQLSTQDQMMTKKMMLLK